MSDDDNFGAGVCRSGALECGQNAWACLNPGEPEAGRYSAAITDVCWYGGKLGVRDEVADRLRAPEGKHCEVVGGINCDVACDIGG